MLFPAYSIHFLRRNQVNLLVNWPDRPNKLTWFRLKKLIEYAGNNIKLSKCKQKQKSNITTFWLTDFLKIYYFLLFEKKRKEKKKRIKT